MPRLGRCRYILIVRFPFLGLEIRILEVGQVVVRAEEALAQLMLTTVEYCLLLELRSFRWPVRSCLHKARL